MTSLSTLTRPVTRAEKRGTRPLRILYADDMKELRDLMGIVLGNEGHLLQTCANGALARDQSVQSHGSLPSTW